MHINRLNLASSVGTPRQHSVHWSWRIWLVVSCLFCGSNGLGWLVTWNIHRFNYVQHLKGLNKHAINNECQILPVWYACFSLRSFMCCNSQELHKGATCAYTGSDATQLQIESFILYFLLPITCRVFSWTTEMFMPLKESFWSGYQCKSFFFTHTVLGFIGSQVWPLIPSTAHVVQMECGKEFGWINNLHHSAFWMT